MSIQFSRVIASHPQGNGRTFSVKAIPLAELGGRASPLLVLDEFRVSGRPFPPHPHAGFAAVTYVFEDSKGDLRSRDSLGNDLVTGPGGIVWTQAGRGVIHEELPANPNRELHAIQLFVNLSSKNKLTPPRMFRLERSAIPEWHSDTGDRVRVVVGSFEGVSSPLVPVEPFQLLDVELRSDISFKLRAGHNALVYVVDGDVTARADGHEQKVRREHAIGIHGDGEVRFDAAPRAHFLILSGTEINEPVATEGPFIMNDSAQLADAVARYNAGEMGNLASASD